MTRRLTAPLSLSRKRIRPSFNKWNVYNALTWRKSQTQKTQYRQVFFAKQETRSYHGDRLTETQFRNHFRGDLPSVGSLENQKGATAAEVPYAMQTFVGLERRLDFAVFRAMFASSVRQAAVFVLRGGVRVNGVKMRSPGYVLRAGDMFSVDPTRVLYALGRPKPSLATSIAHTNRIIAKYNKYLDKCRANPEKMWSQRAWRRRRHRVYNARYRAAEEKRVKKHNAAVKAEMNAAMDSPASTTLETLLQGKQLLQTTTKEAKGMASTLLGLVRSAFPDAKLETDSAKVAAKYYSEEPVPSRGDVKKIVSELQKLRNEEIRQEHQARLQNPGDPEPYDPNWVNRLPANIEPLSAELASAEDVAAAMAAVKLQLPFSPTGKLYGLSEPKKAYFTPWTPRQFLGPMAILPHHLEIDFDTCHAVYLRDPVARPGHSELISPFSLEMHERAYLWYVQRRRKNLPPL